MTALSPKSEELCGQTRWDFSDLRALFISDTTPVELVESAIASIEQLNPLLNAVVTPTFDRALDDALSGVSGP